jgi:hypothetical protein
MSGDDIEKWIAKLKNGEVRFLYIKSKNFEKYLSCYII